MGAMSTGPGPSVPPEADRRGTLGWLGLATVAVLAGVGVWWWGRSPEKPAVPVTALTAANPASLGTSKEELEALFAVANPGYVGAPVCGQCHAERLKEFQATRHFLACLRPEETVMPEGFRPEGVECASHWLGVRFQAARRGTDFIQEVVRESAAGVARNEHRIALVYGSRGKGDEVYFTWQGDRLFELPLGWLHPRNQFGEQPYALPELGSLRTTTPRCLECQAT